MARDKIPEGTAQYGNRYWCIKTSCSEDGEIYVHAEHLEVTSSGALIAWGNFGYWKEGDNPDKAVANLVLAPGHWTVAYAASVLDGSAVAVEHWKGEVLPRK